MYKVSNFSIYTPFCYNHAFTPALLDNTFATWCVKGLKSIKDFYLDNKFASFARFSIKYNLPHSNFFLLELLSLLPESEKLMTKFVSFFF